MDSGQRNRMSFTEVDFSSLRGIDGVEYVSLAEVKELVAKAMVFTLGETGKAMDKLSSTLGEVVEVEKRIAGIVDPKAE